MVRVDVDDQEVLVLAHDRLLFGVAKERAGIELLAREIAEVAVGLVLHILLVAEHVSLPILRCL